MPTSYSLEVLPDAKQDVFDAVTWYNSKQTGLSERFLGELELVFQRIETLPLHFMKVHRNSRQALLSKFPFAVHYFIENERIVVFAIIHTSRNPKRWQSRG